MFKFFKRKTTPSIRPLSLADYKGQERASHQLNIAISSAKQRRAQLGHTVIYGPPGLGKTTLANIIANETKSYLHTSIGNMIQNQEDVINLFVSVNRGDTLFIDEIHSIPNRLVELLYTAMEDGFMDTKQGRISIPKFTLIGATTMLGDLTDPLRDRFMHQIRLEYYSQADLTTLIQRSSSVEGVSIEPRAASLLAGASRGTPRIANKLMYAARDVAVARSSESHISYESAVSAMDILEVDTLGLDRMDRAILSVLIEDYNGAPVGLRTLAASVGEHADTIQRVYEPYLIHIKLIQPTARGRVATQRAIEYLRTVKRCGLY